MFSLPALKSREAFSLPNAMEAIRHISKDLGINEDTLVREGNIPEHPGWEDLIILENLEESIKK